MGISETMNYVLYENPISQSIQNTTKSIMKPILNGTTGFQSSQAPVQIITKPEPLWQLANQSGPFIKIAALSGALAVALAAYGSHKKYPKDQIVELKGIHENANKIHFFHTLALIGVPMTRSPKICGSLLIAGTVLFSGPCYYHAYTGENKFGKLAPIGGTILILGWLAMAF